MRVLVTGNEGTIGRYVEAALCDAGHSVIGFDISTGDDVRDSDAVSRVAAGSEAIIHLAALLPHLAEPSELMNTNLLGTWNVLLAAKKHDIGRIVFFSSVNALGIFMGDRKPDYLPIDDYHGCYPRSAYSVSKRLAEEICRFHTEETGAVTVCLRPPHVFVPSEYGETREQWARDAESEWRPFWEYGAFLDVRDTASAALSALTFPRSGHSKMLLCADDIISTRPSMEMANKFLPDIHVKDTYKYYEDPYRPLVSADRAKEILRWQPIYRWRDQAECKG